MVLTAKAVAELSCNWHTCKDSLRQFFTAKMVLAMRFTALLILSACLTASATGEAQGITLDEKAATLKKIFNSIKQQTNYTFWYDLDLIEGARLIDIKVRNATLTEVLNICTAGQKFTYDIIDNTVVLKLKTAAVQVENDVVVNKPLPPITVRGRVVTENGEGVRATITIKGTGNAVSTNDNGEFEINNVDENATLLISGVNIETREIKVNGKEELGNISMKTKISTGDEVLINAGYYKTTERTKTGSISRVDAKTIERQPISNPLQSLQGRVPGVVITQKSGVPGGGFDIQIRGINSLRTSSTDNGNLPLYIIDGVPFTSTSLADVYTGGSIVGDGSPLNNLNPSDIESIEILKDADATAIYGSRGANGVILITTKRAKPGKTSIDLNFYAGLGKVSRKMDLLNTSQYLEMRIEGLKNNNLWPAPTAIRPFNPDLFLWDTTRYTDWQEKLIGGTADITNANVAVSGGNSNTQFVIRGNYFHEGTVYPGNFSDRKVSGHFNLNHTTDNRKFNISFSATYLNDKNNLPPVDLTNTALKLPPNAPNVYNDDGSLNWMNGTWDNPFSNLLKRYRSISNNLIANTTFSFSPVNNFTFRTSLGYNNITTRSLSTNPIRSQNPSTNPRGSSRFGDNRSTNWTIEPQAELVKRLFGGSVNILVGTTFQYGITEGQSLSASGYTTDALIENILSAPTVAVLGSRFVEYKYTALFGRINYNLNNKYIINLTGRRDGSSRFGPNRQFNSFGAVGAAWIFSGSKFVRKHLPALSYGKWRVSYGSTGSDHIPDYGYADSYSSTSNPYNGVPGLIPSRLANPEFSWEVTRKLEAALELGFARDRILFATSWYRNRSSNQLVGFPLSVVTGFRTMQYNMPATVQNTGWEFQLSTANVKTKNFTWSTVVNLTIPRNELIDYPNIKSSPYAYQYEIGKPLFVKMGYHYIGVDPATGLYFFEDLNGNGSGVDFPTEWRAIKSVTQDFYGGIENEITYKGLQLNFLFQFVKQTGYNYIRSFSTPGDRSNQPVIVMNRWRSPGDNTTVQRFGANTTYNQVTSSDHTISDASFIRLRNLALSYRLPERLTRKWATQANIFLQGQNLFIITNYAGMDPESQNALTLPPLRYLTAGVKLKF